MIIEFTVRNFRSIKDEQTIAFYTATPGQHMTGNIAFPPASGDIHILKSIGIYGANASGKSNLLLAFFALQYVLDRSGDLKDGEPIACYEPYLLADETKVGPISLEIEFLIPGGHRYRYKIAFLKNKIVGESLSLYRSSKETMIFKRTESDTWKSIEFGALYKGGAKRIPFFSNNAYLSKAGNRADAPVMIRDVYNYLLNDIVHIGTYDKHYSDEALEHDDILNKVSRFLSLIDTGVSSIKVKKQKVKEDSIEFPANIPSKIKDRILREHSRQFLFSHRTDTGGMASFEKSYESAGIRKMFDLAPLIMDAFETGGVLIVDELDNSMHPHMAELIIKLFNDSEVNPGRAQLIFSTHNIGLMSPELFRRDQIWFSEKINGASRFFSLDDFDKKKVTPTSPFSRWYAEGRFRATPQIDYKGIVDLLKQGVGRAQA